MPGARHNDVRFVVIEAVSPLLDGGRYPIKRIVGETLVVEADVFGAGHDLVMASLLWRRGRDDEPWHETAFAHFDNDRFRGSIVLDRMGHYGLAIEAWPDLFGSWRRDLARSVAAGNDVANELHEGRALVAAAAGRANASMHDAIACILHAYDTQRDDGARAVTLLDPALASLVARAADRSNATRYDVAFAVDVDRVAARFSAWYEFFPRSTGAPGIHGTFVTAAARLPAIAAMGFDVVYLPPIHPIGHAFRKGPNNSLEPVPSDPGSPWAIGNAEGGHMAIEPALGTVADFEAFVATARDCGLEIALDFALQCSPDHPYVSDHPEWFAFRADGSIKYAENPPKKYQDIVNFDWTSPAAPALWSELREIVRFWIARGVRIFRVDNPHTKPFAFWEWLIAEIRAGSPETLFLAEAFTRPKVMARLAKIGFTMSYTYFTWRTTKDELSTYVMELAQTELAEYYRPSFWPNTPDILSPFLQTGGVAAFRIRLVLAATLASLYGIYSGYELSENAALPGREEYADSEKYELRPRAYDVAGSLAPEIARINAIRRAHPAFHDWRNVTFYRADDDAVLFFGKRHGDDIVLVAINLDPLTARDALLWLPTGDLNLRDDDIYRIDELLGETTHLWQGSPHRWRLDPQINPAAIFQLTVTA